MVASIQTFGSYAANFHPILDPLDFIHAVTSQIPDRGQDCVRYLGAYANRIRRKHVGRQPVPTASRSSDDDGHDFNRSRRRS